VTDDNPPVLRRAYVAHLFRGEDFWAVLDARGRSSKGLGSIDPSYIKSYAALIDVVGRILHSFTDNMPRREIQGVGYVESRAC
jgi:hypothetical protein